MFEAENENFLMLDLSSSQMEVEVLGSGTSQGVPVIGCHCPVCLSKNPKDQRLRSSILVKKGSVKVLVDVGPDLRQQLLRSGTEDIDAVLITHEHQDHTAGLDELRAINFIQKHPIPIYCSETVEIRLREQYSYIFKNANYPGIPQIHFKRIPASKFNIGAIEIEPIHALHWELPVLGFRFGDLAYITDANYIAPPELEKLQQLKILILNALRQEEHHSHFNLEQALSLADSLKVEQFYATHISHQMGMHQEIQSNLPPQKFLAFDGLMLRP